MLSRPSNRKALNTSEDGYMKATTAARLALLAGIVIFTLTATQMNSQRGATGPISIGSTDLGGVVTSTNGPEAGVWVIAETTDLPTKFAKIVVTDGQGRYLLPDLPRATYQVFVRGYGLVDSPRQPAKPGQQLNLTAPVAPDARSAAQVYPAAWWFS